MGVRSLMLAGFVGSCMLQATPAAAQSCGCVCPADGPPFFRTLVSPQVLAPNARVLARLAGYDSSTLQLETAAGEPVPVTLTPAGDSRGTAFWVVPNTRLAPGGYTLSVARTDGSSTYARDVVVGTDDDVTPPALSNLRADDLGGLQSCSASVGMALVWDVPATVGGDALDGEYVPEVSLVRDGVPLGTVFPLQVGVGGTSWFATAADPDCFGAAAVEGLTADSDVTASVRIWDLAGNATSTQSLTFRPAQSVTPPTPPCRHGGCTALPTAGADLRWVLFATLAAVVGARRRRGSRIGDACNPP